MSSLQRVEDNWKVSSVMKSSISLLNKNKKQKNCLIINVPLTHMYAALHSTVGLITA